MEYESEVWERAIQILDQLWFNEILETSSFGKAINNLSKKVIEERGKKAVPYIQKYIDIKLSKNPREIISGGQTGADQGGLEAARHLGIITRGTAPKGFLTELGSNYNLKKFHLIEHASSSYVPRTIDNIENSDGTLAFLVKRSVGTGKTIGYCRTKKWQYSDETNFVGYRPVLVISKIDNFEIVPPLIKHFVEVNNIKILNIAGHRENSVPGIQEKVRKLVIEAFYADHRIVE